jgi:hypothetical protein
MLPVCHVQHLGKSEVGLHLVILHSCRGNCTKKKLEAKGKDLLP